VALNALALVLAIVLPGERITVRAEAGLEKQAREVAAQAPRDLARIEADLEGLPRIDRIEVRLVKHAEDIAAAAPPGRGAPSWAIGTAYPDDGVVVVAFRGKDGDILDVRRTLAHELAHMALDRAVGGDNVPRWLTEGFAYLHSSDFSLARATTLTGAVLGNHIEPLWRLETAFPAREDEAALAYAESYDFVAYLAERDPGAFRRFLGALAAKSGLDAAARDTFGRRFVDLESEWIDSLRGRYLWTFVGVGGALVWVLGAVLLVLGYWRRRRQMRRTLARWAIEEDRDDDI
jgi:Peptidase MA superfamily